MGQLDKRVPIIVTGDFNENIRASHDFRSVLDDHNISIANIPTYGYTTKLVKNFQNIPNWSDEFDFVLTRGPVEEIGELTPVNDDTVVENGMCPSFMFPSDHLA